jgi:hypothetical protein
MHESKLGVEARARTNGKLLVKDSSLPRLVKRETEWVEVDFSLGRRCLDMTKFRLAQELQEC